MRSWKSTIGGAFGALGTFLVGAGTVPQIASGYNNTLMWISVAGFSCQGLGIFFGHLFTADRTDVRRMIADSEDDTRTLLRGKENVRNAEGAD